MRKSTKETAKQNRRRERFFVRNLRRFAFPRLVNDEALSHAPFEGF